jgi:hypothetical protein
LIAFFAVGDYYFSKVANLAALRKSLAEQVQDMVLRRFRRRQHLGDDARNDDVIELLPVTAIVLSEGVKAAAIVNLQNACQVKVNVQKQAAFYERVEGNFGQVHPLVDCVHKRVALCPWSPNQNGGRWTGPRGAETVFKGRVFKLFHQAKRVPMPFWFRHKLVGDL